LREEGIGEEKKGKQKRHVGGARGKLEHKNQTKVVRRVYEGYQTVSMAD
jgi:hypothetical protein